MLLRCSSTPILNSWIPQSGYMMSASPETEFQLLQRTKSFASCSKSSLHIADHDQSRMSSAIPALTISRASSARKLKCLQSIDSVSVHEIEPRTGNELGRNNSFRNLVSCSELQEIESKCVQQPFVNGGIGSGGGGRIHRGSGGGSGSHESDSTDAYYQKMIEANPNNPLLLGNYARFLIEVQGDRAKAEEFCGKAILANPRDGSLLSLYADLIWESDRDVERAENYFDLAVQNAPDDCYVLASYAKFLWDAEDEGVRDGKHGDEHHEEMGFQQTIMA